jgi:hypothetical protein
LERAGLAAAALRAISFVLRKDLGNAF